MSSLALHFFIFYFFTFSFFVNFMFFFIFPFFHLFSSFPFFQFFSCFIFPFFSFFVFFSFFHFSFFPFFPICFSFFEIVFSYFFICFIFSFFPFLMKYHLCFVSFSNTPIPLFLVPTRCVLSQLLLRNHCRVGTFIRIDFCVFSPFLFQLQSSEVRCSHTNVELLSVFFLVILQDRACCMAQVTWKCRSHSLVVTCTSDRCLHATARAQRVTNTLSFFIFVIFQIFHCFFFSFSIFPFFHFFHFSTFLILWIFLRFFLFSCFFICPPLLSPSGAFPGSPRPPLKHRYFPQKSISF